MQLFLDKRLRIEFGREQGLMKKLEFLDNSNQAYFSIELN